MTEQLIEFETAKLAYDKGFSEVRNIAYTESGSNSISTYSTSYREDKYPVNIVSQSLLARWLREVHKIFVTVSYNKHIKLGWESHVDKKGMSEHSYYCNGSYEEALEEGLKQALTLIKL